VGVELEQLREKLGNYEHVVETMNCGLAAEDQDSKIAFVNQTLLTWLGYTRDELIGRPVETLVPQELHQFMHDDALTAENGDLRARLVTLRRKDSTTFPVVLIPQLFVTAERVVDGFFYVVVDLGAVLTARQMGPASAMDVRPTLQRIALELESLCLTAAVGATTALPLHHPDLQGLSPREAEVLSLLVGGDRVPSIAQRLHISQHTVRNHLKSVFRKLDVANQSELIERVRSLADGAPPDVGTPPAS